MNKLSQVWEVHSRAYHIPQELGGRGSSGKVHPSREPQFLRKPWHFPISWTLEYPAISMAHPWLYNIIRIYIYIFILYMYIWLYMLYIPKSSQSCVSKCRLFCYVETCLKTKARANVNSKTFLNLLACFSWLLKTVPHDTKHIWIHYMPSLSITIYLGWTSGPCSTTITLW